MQESGEQSIHSIAVGIIDHLTPRHRAIIEGLVIILARLEQLETKDPSYVIVPRQPLTPRDKEVLCLVAQGYSNKRIAYRLGCVESTVKNRVSTILEKVDALNRAHAVSLALRHGWILVEKHHIQEAIG